MPDATWREEHRARREARHEARREGSPRHSQREEHLGRGRDAEASRRAILEAAERVFAHDGFSGARIDEIAREAGYNKSLIFQYFGDKLGLYREVVRCMKDEGAQHFARLVGRYTENGAPTAEQTRDFIATSVRWTFDRFLARPNLVRILTWEAAEGWEAYREAHETPASGPAPSQWTGALVEYLQQAQRLGYIRPELDLRLLIASVISQAEHYLVSIPRFERLFPGADFSSPEALHRAREQIVNVTLHGACLTYDMTRDAPESTDTYTHSTETTTETTKETPSHATGL